MRVISGTARGRRLTPFAGTDVRPTPDRVREALFSMLASRLGSFSGRSVLDLFAGSGALAIEALSRGAASALLVEQAPEALRTIRANLALCHLAERATLLHQDAFKALPSLSSQAPFDLIFLDPPYRQGHLPRALAEIDRIGLLADDGILCAETAADEDLPDDIGRLEQSDRRRYGTVMISLYTITRQGPA